jgi:hypothetical protein
VNPTERPELAVLSAYTPTSWDSVTGNERIGRWKQGDLLGPLPWGWVAPAGWDQVTNLEVDTDGGALAVVVAPTGLAQAIVTSQTCDIAVTGPGARHPFVQVSPVLAVPEMDPSKLAALKRGDVVDLALLTPPGGWHIGPLIADLRVSIPVSKAVLAAQDPQPGFADEAGYLAFARQLATKLERPALRDFITGDARAIIQTALAADAKVNTGWWSQVEEVRVKCDPNRLEPSLVEFIVVARTRALAATDVDKWKQVNERIRSAGKKVGISVRHPLHETATSMLAMTYRASVQLDLPQLRQPRD